MTLTAAIALFVSMIVLALIPGPGVIAVIARSTTVGLKHGVTTSLGIITGDFIFITFALLGLSTLATLLGELFILIKFIGAAYLIWLGFSLMFSKKKSAISTKTAAPKHSASFVVGLITTLANPKAILFYLSFFPAFIDLAALSAIDILFVYLIAALAIGGVMFAYAVIAFKAKAKVANSRQSQLLRIGSGSLLIGSGAMLALKN